MQPRRQQPIHIEVKTGRLKKRRLVAYTATRDWTVIQCVWMCLCMPFPDGSVHYWFALSVCLYVRPSVQRMCLTHELKVAEVEIWCTKLWYFEIKRSNGYRLRGHDQSWLISIFHNTMMRYTLTSRHVNCIFLVTAKDVAQVNSAWPSHRG